MSRLIKAPLLIIALGIASRLIPHMPNFSPLIIFAFYLGLNYSRTLTLCAVLLMAVISDGLLALTQHYAWFGVWSFFTYSGLLLVGLSSSFCHIQLTNLRFIHYGALATLFYWLWTNLGVWLVGRLYPHTFVGLLSCYTLGLPFLASTMLCSLLWAIAISFSGCLDRITPQGHDSLQRKKTSYTNPT